MLLTLTNTQPPATDLGFLLHKHPDRVQRYDLSFGAAHVFYPEAGEARCTACLLVDVDPVELVRGKSRAGGGLLDQYVNDRPYAASSFLSVAIGQVFSTALTGRCAARPELMAQPLPLTAHLPVTPARGDEDLVPALFEPLGYEVEMARLPLDERFPDWGDSPYVSLTLSATITVNNVNYEFLPAGRLRHPDHRFEWTRAEFESWGQRVAATFGYAVRFVPVGEVDAAVGAPTQMAVFVRSEGSPSAPPPQPSPTRGERGGV